MTDDSKFFEKNLDRDFLYYLNILEEVNQNIKDNNEKEVCAVWLNHLLGKKNCSVAEKCDRNIFLSRLLLQMQNGKLKGIFQEAPPTGALPCAFSTFGLPTELDDLKGIEEKGFQVDPSIAGASGDFLETSRDGRTYLATRHLPQGIMAFMAITSNEGDEIWSPQECPVEEPAPPPQTEVKDPGSNFERTLNAFIGGPISQHRKSVDERDLVIDWMDGIISDCNKWISGEDPHNKELEVLFEVMYNELAKNSDRCMYLDTHPLYTRGILIREIRDQIAEKRAEVIKRKLILDQYEADEYSDRKIIGEVLDDVWVQCAHKPLGEGVSLSLQVLYPMEVINRFYELLIQERLDIIEKGERNFGKKMAEIRSASVQEIRKELLKLKKAQQEYKELYQAYTEIEQKQSEYLKEWKERCSKMDKPDQQQNIEKTKREIEAEIEQAKQMFDKERRNQNDMKDKLEEAKEAYTKMKEAMDAEMRDLTCKSNLVNRKKEDLERQIEVQKRRRDELKCKLMLKRNECAARR